MSAIIVLMSVTTIGYHTSFALNKESKLNIKLSENKTSQNKTIEKLKTIKNPEVTAEVFMVMSGSTSEIVYSSRANRKLQPGCVTKYMVAMVVIDNMYNSSELKNSVTITKQLAEYGDTFKLGESVKVGDLIKAMLIGNSDQAAEALATYSASGRKIFVNEMNAKATELGLMDTHFTNPSGVHSTEQYSTASDCAIIVQAAIRYKEIKNLSKLKSCKVTAGSGKTKKYKERTITFDVTNPLIGSKVKEQSYRYIRQGISGNIDYSAQFAGISLMDDMQLIVIILDGREDRLAADAKSLFEYGYNKVTRNTIVKADKKVGSVRIRGGVRTKLPVYTETKGFAYVPPEGSTELVNTKIVVQNDLEAPVQKGQKVGEFQIYVANELKGTVDLVVKNDVAKGWLPSQFYISNFGFVLICIFVIPLILLVLRIRYVKKRRAKRREVMRKRKIAELAYKQIALDADRRKRNWTYSNFYETDSIRNETNKKIEKEDNENK